jgi:hypothetical protein
MMRDARRMTGGETDVLQAEAWASAWLGDAWLAAPLGEREPEERLCLEVTGRASTTPSPPGFAAIAALARVAPEASQPMLASTVTILAETQPLPAWHDAGDHRPVCAWRAVDVYDSERVLLIAYDGPVPHTLMAQITEPGGTLVDKLVLLAPEAASAWTDLRDDEDVPMPLPERPVPDTLADLASALRITDMTWPRHDDEDYVALGALAWSRCRDHLPGWPDHEELPEAERDRLLAEFTATRAVPTPGADAATVRSLVDLFLDYGENYIASGPLCWSPAHPALFLTDWLPRKAVLDQAHRALLPQLLKDWVRWALTERGVAGRWIAHVTDTVDTHLPDFEAAFDDRGTWGPAKQTAAALAARGVDLTDLAAVDAAVNAERLAQQLTGRPAHREP